MGTTWLNNDGLVVPFGTSNPNYTYSFAISKNGAQEEIEIRIKDATQVALAPADGVVHPRLIELVNGPIIPANSTIESCTVYVDTAFTSGGAAVLHVGSYSPTTNLAVDANGFVSAAVASLTVDTDVAGAGALIGASVTADTRVGVGYATAAFTAGTARIILRYTPYPTT